ncbi:MAG: hypothetical protein PVI30_20615 [Myxococcales bacterium]|jgi:hypothetical protein
MSTVEPSKQELLRTDPRRFDTDSLRFEGLRGDSARHLGRRALEAGLLGLSAAPRDQGTVELMVARGPEGQRELLEEAPLTVEGGMPGDRWAGDDRYGPTHQLATIRADVARLIANGQPLELHGDNLYLNLDLSADNLPSGTVVRMGEATLEVTPQAHNGCKKWAQRFGLDAMQLNLDSAFRPMRIRGMYFRVVEDGTVCVGDAVRVIRRSS